MKQKKTDKILGELLSYSNSSQNLLFNKFLEERINEIRVLNDTADEDGVKKNQGAIKELQRILKLISLPDQEDRTPNKAYDGVYV